MNINELLELSIQHNASDLHLVSNKVPILRIAGELHPLPFCALSQETLLAFILETLPEKQKSHFQKMQECDYALTWKEQRFRINAFYQYHGISMAIRCLPKTLHTLADLNVPPIVYSLCKERQGLILITGATGSGKSTTLAAMVEHINQTQRKHIITLEEPIEYVHRSEQCLIQQREIKRHSKSFTQGLRMALREDPDIILVGEMRDPETIRLALTAAETGHLVLSTLHTQSAIKTLDRIIQAFPAREQAFIRSLLAHTLQAVVAQQLVKKTVNERMAIFEVLINSNAVSHLIRENKIAQIYSVMQTQKGIGMQVFPD